VLLKLLINELEKIHKKILQMIQRLREILTNEKERSLILHDPVCFIN